MKQLLLSVDDVNKTYKYNYEFYLMKHFSHFVKPNARKINTSGTFQNVLAFENVDKSIVVVVYNDSTTGKKTSIKIKNKTINPVLQPSSFNTFLIK